MLAVLAVVVLGTAASAAPGDFARTEAFEFFTGSSEQASCMPGDAARTMESEDAHLKGPHFAASILCRYAGGEMPAITVDNSLGLAELPPLDAGTDMLAVQFALAPRYQPEVGKDGVTAWIEAGSERFDLEWLPAAWDFVAVTVPTGEDAVLWIEDEGRAQGWNLRTVERIDPVASYYNGLPEEADSHRAYSYQEQSVLNSTKGYRVTCGGGVLASRHMWLDGHGWAPERKVFLQLYLSWCDDFEDIFRWELDQEVALTVRDGGDRLVPESWSEGEGESADRLYVTAVFEVPEDQAEFSVDFTPVGDLVNLSGGEDYYFRDTLETTEWTFNF